MNGKQMVTTEQSNGLPAEYNGGSLAVSLARAEVDQQISTARSYPRSIARAVEHILTLATLDELSRRQNQNTEKERRMIFDEIQAEVKRAEAHGDTFNSLHEAYAVILEELDEVWDIARKKRKDRSITELRKEFIQLAAMSVKALNSLGNFVGGSV